MTPRFLLFLCPSLIHAAGTLTVSTPGYPAHRAAEYTISHVDLDEIAGTTVPVTFRFAPGVANVTDVELWTNVNRRDHCVVAAPSLARDVRLYEVNVFNIEASGDTFASRSTLEDLHNAPGAPHNGSNRWDLDYLVNLGCNWRWFQPIHPNGIDGREVDPGTGNPYDPGSPYAVKNFFEVNGLMTKDYNGGNSVAQNRAAAMSAWQAFAAAADSREVGIMLDAPFNHTAFDVELAQKGVELFQWDGAGAWSPADQIRNRDARFFSRVGNYGLRAFDAGSIAPGPDRFDFGKWNDVKDVFFGRYDALVEVDSEPERSSHTSEGDWFDTGQFEWTNGDFTQGGQPRNVTRRTWQYFAHYAVHWLEATRPAGENRNSLLSDGGTAARRAWDARGIDGLRCDFGQGLPPRCWEYIINVARSKKWSFVMMSESLDGGNVTYRSARQFDVLNENISVPLKAAADKHDYRNIYESRRTAYGQALVLANTTSHDEEVLPDPWQSVVRYLACGTLDGVPLVFPGQELGIATTYGYDRYETNLGKRIPHFKRWNSMMPVWNNTDYGNDQLYPVIAAANRARAASPALRSSQRWFLDGAGNNPRIHAVAKYENANGSPAFSDVVIAFANLDRDNAQGDNFKIPAALAAAAGQLLWNWEFRQLHLGSQRRAGRQHRIMAGGDLRGRDPRLDGEPCRGRNLAGLFRQPGLGLPGADYRGERRWCFLARARPERWRRAESRLAGERRDLAGGRGR